MERLMKRQIYGKIDKKIVRDRKVDKKKGREVNKRLI